jgi:hypothetical protein
MAPALLSPDQVKGMGDDLVDALCLMKHNGAVEKTLFVHFAARSGCYDIVAFIDHVELFAVMLRGRGGGGIEGAGEVDPLRHGEIFRAAGGREVLSGAPRGPRCGVGLEQGFQLLAALTEAALHEVVEEDGADRREFARSAALEEDEGVAPGLVGEVEGEEAQVDLCVCGVNKIIDLFI